MRVRWSQHRDTSRHKASPEVDNGEAGEVPPGCSLHDSFFHCGNKVLGNGSAEDVIDELEASTTNQGFHLDLAIAELPMAAALFFVPPMRVGLAPNCFPVWDLRSFQYHFGVVALLQLGDDYLNVLLASAGDEKFLGLRIAEEADHLVFFH